MDLYDDAIKDFDTAIKLEPNFANAYHNRGFAYEKKGNFALANQDMAMAKQLQLGLQ